MSNSQLPEVLPFYVATFDGEKSWIDVVAPGKEIDLTITDTMTVEAWVRPTTSETSAEEKDIKTQVSEFWLARHPVVGQHAPAVGWELRCGGHEAEFMITLDGKHQYAKTDQIQLDAWNHLAGVYDGEEVKIYLNGNLEASHSFPGSYSRYLKELSIGHNAHFNRDRVKERLFDGQIAEVRVWNIAQTESEIQEAMCQRLKGNEEGLVGYWRLDDGPGEKVYDRSANKFDGEQNEVEWTSALVLSNADAAEREDVLEERDQIKKDLEAARKECDELTDAKDKEIESLKRKNQELIAKESDCQEKISELEKQRDQHLETLAVYEQDPEKPVALTELIRNLNEQITRSREEMVAQGGTYRLGRVTMELKMRPFASGRAMIFPKHGEEGNSTGLSTINLDFSPKTTSDALGNVSIFVPDLTGYTELMAERKLREAGLIMDVAFQAVTVEKNKPSPIDRVVNQQPKPDQQVQPSSRIQVFLGKETNDLKNGNNE